MDLPISFPGVYPTEVKIDVHTKTCIQMLRAVPFGAAKSSSLVLFFSYTLAPPSRCVTFRKRLSLSEQGISISAGRAIQAEDTAHAKVMGQDRACHVRGTRMTAAE